MRSRRYSIPGVYRPETPRITVFAMSALGDLLNAVPMAAALRVLYPSCIVSLITMRKATETFACDLGIADHVIRIAENARRSPVGLAQAVAASRGLRPEIVLQSFSSHGTLANLMAGTSGARVRCGFASGRLQGLLTHAVPIVVKRHHLELNLDLLRRLGHTEVAAPTGRYLPAIEDGSTAYADHPPRERLGRYVVVSVGSDPRLFFKRWPAQKWGRLTRLLAAEGVCSAFVGAPSERSAVAEIMGAGGCGIDLTGKTAFPDLARLIADSDAVVGTDGMLLHLGASLGKHCIGVFGPTHPVEVGPWGPRHDTAYMQLPCSPCYTSLSVGKGIRCKTQECLHALSVRDVARMVLAASTRLERGDA